MSKKVILAYSGGLDTSVILKWLVNKGYDVICYVANVGQREDFAAVEQKALKTGASKVYIEDLRREFVNDYIFAALRGNAIYEGRYLLGTSLARPLIAQRQVEIDQMEKTHYYAHGATGKGNDQVRFELTVMALNPRLRIIAPWREWEIRSRKDALEYAAKHNVPVTATEKSIYSRDRNFWHISHEGGLLENPWLEPEEAMHQLSVAPEQAPDQPEYLEIDFKQGLPVRVNGVAHGPLGIMEALNAIGGRHGIGRVDLVENRLVGIKSHGVYETPGGALLYLAHQGIEELVLDRETLHYKLQVALKYADLVYNGQWFTPLREALDAFVNVTQHNVSGRARFKLYKGQAILVGRQSPHSLYREDYATFDQDDVYNQQDAEGFIKLFGLPLKVQAMIDIEGSGVSKYRQPDFSQFKRD